MLRVDVSAEDGRVRFARADAPTRALRAPLVLGPTQRVAYAIPQQPWTLRSLLSNPMYVVMGLMAAMMFLMPRLMENIDPEVRPIHALLSTRRSWLTHRNVCAGAEADAGPDGQGRHAGAAAGVCAQAALRHALHCACAVACADVARLQGALMGEPVAPPPKKKALEGGAGAASSGGGGNKKKH